MGYYSRLDIGTISGGGGELYVSTGAVLSGTTGYLGSSAGGYAWVYVDGTGAQWNNSGYLLVGASGAGHLNITNGGKVTSGGSGKYSVIGNDAGSTGSVSLDSTGSQWTINDDLYVGGGGNGSLYIHNGAKVTDAYASIANSSTSTSTVTVYGSNAQWISSGDLYVGNGGNGTLTIQSGGKVTDTTGYIARNSGSIGTATVTGAGSQWTNSGELNVGYAGSGTLSIQNGGFVSNTYSYIGRASGSTGSVTVTGAGSQWTSTSPDLVIGSSGTGTITVDAGGKVTAPDVVMALSGSGKGTLNLNGSSGSRGVLGTTFVSEGSGTGGGTINFNGGILRATADSSNFLQNFESGDVQIQGGGAFIDTNGQNVTIGTALQGSDDRSDLTKQGAGTLTLTGSSSYRGNTIINGGTLQITSGGSLTGGGATNISPDVGSTAAAIVTGAGSQWDSGFVEVGTFGIGTLTIQDGGRVNTSGMGIIGEYSGSTGMASVTGSGSKWTTGQTLGLGIGGGFGTLNVQSGGSVTSYNGVIGNGVATVTGIGSVWTNQNYLNVGDDGNGTLNILSGSTVVCDSGYIAHSSSTFYSSTGTVTVTGTGSQWNIANELHVGEGGNGTLNVQSGGTISSDYGSIGTGSGSTGLATVTGTGSQWNTNYLDIGVAGDGTLNIQSGGKVNSNHGGISTGNLFTGTGSGLVTISGIGSQWTISNNLMIGFSGNGTLNVHSGGTVSSAMGYVGEYGGSNGVATVNGTGSQWTSMGLTIGNLGSGTLNVTDGGNVTVSGGYRYGSVELASESGSTGTLNLGNGSTAGMLNAATVSGGFGTATVNFNHTGSYTFAPQLTGTLAVDKLGSGTTILTGNNTYTGATTVSQGRLAVNGNISTSITTVNSGGTLGGSGTVGAVMVTSGGTIAAGNSIESLATGNLSLAGGSTFAYEMNNDASPGVAGDLTAVNGTVDLSILNDANLSLTELGSGSWSLGEKLTLISYSGAWNGGLFKLGGGTLADDSIFAFSGMDWKFNYNDTTAGSNWTDDLSGPSYVTMTAVPEPGSLLLIGCSSLALLRRRRISANASSMPENLRSCRD